MHHYLLMCPVSDCTETFESSTALDAHIAADLHNVQTNTRRTTNDTARLHLTEIIRKINIHGQEQTTGILQSQNVSNVELSSSAMYEKFSSSGWALRTRKHTNRMSDKVKDFIEKLWLDSQQMRSKLTPEQIQQQIRTKRDANGEKLFQTNEYPTLNQIKYRCRKAGQLYGDTGKQELMLELMESNTQ